MNRIYVEKLALNDNVLHVSESDYHHLIHVVRLQPGEEIEIVMPDNTWQLLRFDGLSGRDLAVTALNRPTAFAESPLTITLVQGLPKGDKMDELLKKCTEMGVRAFVPVICQRSIPSWDDKKAAKAHERWVKIVSGAAAQSHQPQVPEVHILRSWGAFLTQCAQPENGLRYVLWEAEHDTQFSEQLILDFRRQLVGAGQVISMTLVVGPEGGLARAEIESLMALGFVPVSLGKSILRTENAGFAASAIAGALASVLSTKSDLI